MRDLGKIQTLTIHARRGVIGTLPTKTNNTWDPGAQ